MSDQSKKYNRPMSEASNECIFSAASQVGILLSISLNGAGPCGPEAALASRSARPEKAKGEPTSGTCGPLGSGSSSPVGRPLSSENRSPAHSSSEIQCKTCGTVKSSDSFRMHNRGGFRGTCRDCENSQVRETKPWRSDAKRLYQTTRRRTHRGFSLTNDACRRAKERGLAFDLDWRDIQDRIDAGLCEVTGLPFDLDTPKAWNAPSIDQIVAGAGYTKDNTRVVLYALNTMANAWGVDLILTIAEAVRKKRSLDASNELSRRLAESLKHRLTKYGSTLFVMTWREQVTPSGHRFWRHVPSRLRTSGSGFSSWPTPTRQDSASSGATYDRTETHHRGVTLTDAARMASWATPRAEDSEQTGAHRGTPDTLNSQSKLAAWATPHASDAKGFDGPNKANPARPLGQMPAGSHAETGRSARFQLNPRFSLWLMLGPFAIAWARCAEAVTRSSRRLPASSSARTKRPED